MYRNTPESPRHGRGHWFDPSSAHETKPLLQGFQSFRSRFASFRRTRTHSDQNSACGDECRGCGGDRRM